MALTSNFPINLSDIQTETGQTGLNDAGVEASFDAGGTYMSEFLGWSAFSGVYISNMSGYAVAPIIETPPLLDFSGGAGGVSSPTFIIDIIWNISDIPNYSSFSTYTFNFDVTTLGEWRSGRIQLYVLNPDQTTASASSITLPDNLYLYSVFHSNITISLTYTANATQTLNFRVRHFGEGPDGQVILTLKQATLT